MQSTHTTPLLNTRHISLILATLSILSLVFMLHHPSISANDVSAGIEEAIHESFINRSVHGVLLLITIVISVCLTAFAQLRGLRVFSNLLAVSFYWLGTLAMVVAALASGMIGPYLAESYAQAQSVQLDIYAGLTTLKSAFNQAFANFGTLAWCAGIGCWAVNLMGESKGVKGFAFLSLVMAMSIAMGLLLGWLNLNVNGMTAILVCISVWQLGIAILMYIRPRSDE